jgi:hypothetical protein
MTISRQIIEDAHSALHELYGLVPKRDRKKYADGHLATLKAALRASDKLVSQMNEIECLAVMARRDLELVSDQAATRIVEQ